MSSFPALKELIICLGDANHEHMQSKMTVIESNHRHNNRREVNKRSTVKEFTGKNSI